MMKKVLLVCVSMMLVAAVANADMTIYDDSWKFPLSGWMGEKSSSYPDSASLTVGSATIPEITPYQGTFATKITYDKTMETWAGIYAQYSANWNPIGGGEGTDLLGYQTLSIRGYGANIKVEFGLGEANDSCGTIHTINNPETLLPGWTEYQATNLTAYNMSDVNGLFFFSISASDNELAPDQIVFYIDDVRLTGGAQGVVTVIIVGGTVGVSVTGTIDLGTINAGDIVTPSGSFDVQNIGTVTENYKLSLINPGGWTALNATSATPSAPGHNQYIMMALFTGASGSPPASLTFGADGNDSLINTLRSASDINYSDSSIPANAKGINVPLSEHRYLYIKFWAPSTTSVAVQQRIIIAITAEKA